MPEIGINLERELSQRIQTFDRENEKDISGPWNNSSVT